MAVSRIFENPFYVYFKKHICPKCKTKLKTIKMSKVVNSKSPDAEEYDFSCVDGYFIGNVKFIWTEFECSSCKFRIKIKDMKKLERGKKIEADG